MVLESGVAKFTRTHLWAGEGGIGAAEPEVSTPIVTLRSNLFFILTSSPALSIRIKAVNAMGSMNGVGKPIPHTIGNRSSLSNIPLLIVVGFVQCVEVNGHGRVVICEGCVDSSVDHEGIRTSGSLTDLLDFPDACIFGSQITQK